MPFSAIPTEKAFAKLQQYLPLAVLKLFLTSDTFTTNFWVATVLTACGIETFLRIRSTCNGTTVSCNSTYRLRYWNSMLIYRWVSRLYRCNSTYRLRYWNIFHSIFDVFVISGCNSTYRLRYWNNGSPLTYYKCHIYCCNSTYRLRYWNLHVFDTEYEEFFCVATVLTACGIETAFVLDLLIATNQLVATVLTACGIETRTICTRENYLWCVATVLTACGIETN